MPNVSLSAFLPLVHPHAPGCPDFIAILALRHAAIEFCERTKCWRHISSVTLTTNGQALVTPNTATIHLIEEATLDGVSLAPVQFTDISPDELSGITQAGQPQYITQTDPGTVLVYPFIAGGTLRVSAFLKPRGDSSYGGNANDPMEDANAVVPDFLLHQDAEAISNGALARILAAPGVRWTDQQQALFYRALFDGQCRNRFSRHMHGQQRAPIRTKGSYM
jgi:hypothetical protein